MKDVHLIIVGKLKDREFEIIEDDFKKRIQAFKLSLHEVKSSGDDSVQEGKEVLSTIQKLMPKMDSAQIMLLAEWGKLHESSVQFATWLKGLLEGSGTLFFVIGGASGHSEELVKASKGSLSLSPLTYPHKMARLLFIEQLYRAQTIWSGHPYNK